AALLAANGALAVFTTNPKELNEHYLVPENAEGAQIPEYEGASLGYQQELNHGVLWYFVSVDVPNAQVHVQAIPVVDSLSLKPVNGLSVARSLTLRFEAIGRRPAGSLATRATESSPAAGYDNYVEIPAPSCGNRALTCVGPSYAFKSSDPTIGDFVVPSGEGSRLPKLDASGHPIHSSSSGLSCAYNSGSTTVSIAAGLLSYSLPVTVRAGGFGAPCGTVYRAGAAPKIYIHNSQNQSRTRGAAAPPAPPPALASANQAPAPVPPPPAPVPPAAAKAPAAPPPAPAPSPAVEPPLPAPIESVPVVPSILPAATPPVEPIPPGASGYAQSPAAAKRKEEARKHASQSAYVVRPAGVSGSEWFYGVVGATMLVALMLSARSLPRRTRSRPALALERTAARERRHPRR
ncbi:MAG TPA: hypothetical protein VH137_09450, partial [Gemmatimonadales bacterium]|nr:hypothetical protein [Gemmatimonadales bacterium]